MLHIERSSLPPSITSVSSSASIQSPSNRFLSFVVSSLRTAQSPNALITDTWRFQVVIASGLYVVLVTRSGISAKGRPCQARHLA